jgi:hypothetical protein
VAVDKAGRLLGPVVSLDGEQSLQRRQRKCREDQEDHGEPGRRHEQDADERRRHQIALASGRHRRDGLDVDRR